jgi:nucleoside-diphosphate-sugar epimerase
MGGYARLMAAGPRVVVTGASGNVGTSVVEALSADPTVDSVLGLARRRPEWSCPKLEWARVDVGEDGDLDQFVTAADAVVGAYSPGSKRTPVTESWPAAAYTREKAYLERYLDSFEERHRGTRVVRMRPAFLFKRESAAEQRRLFAGGLARPGLIPVVPDVRGLRVQALHTDDAAEANRLALTREVRGAFNLAADPVLDASVLADLLDARRVPAPRWVLRAPLVAAWRLHAMPAAPDLFDAVPRMPIMDSTRARTELGWTPRRTATEAVEELLAGMRDGAGMPTPPLAPRVPGGRLHELRTGVGKRP